MSQPLSSRRVACVRDFGGLDPAIATGAGAERLHRRDVDVRLGEFLGDFDDRSRPVVTLEEEASLLSAQYKPSTLSRSHEGGAILPNEIYLGSARALWKRGNAQEVDAGVLQGREDSSACARLVRHRRVTVIDRSDLVWHGHVLSLLESALAGGLLLGSLNLLFGLEPVVELRA